MRPLPRTTHSLAERHEALWLRLTTLHRDVSALAAKKPDAEVGGSERAMAEGLMAEARPFLSEGRSRLPVAAPLLAGLAVQLGQVLAQMETFENRHAFWDAGQGLRCWRVTGDPLPMTRLRQLGKVPQASSQGDSKVRETFMRMMKNRERFLYQEGFRKGQAARLGPPDPAHLEPDWLDAEDEEAEIYPRPGQAG